MKNLFEKVFIYLMFALVGIGLLLGYKSYKNDYNRLLDNINQNGLYKTQSFTKKEIKNLIKNSDQVIFRRMDSIARANRINRNAIKKYTTIENHYNQTDTVFVQTYREPAPFNIHPSIKADTVLTFSEKDKCFSISGYVTDSNIIFTNREYSNTIDILLSRNRPHWWMFWKENKINATAFSECGDITIREIIQNK